jgi:CheY-like chemotaxis protein
VQLDTPSLLITDDDRDFRETLRGVFERRGFRTLTAEDGEQAVQIVLRERVHLVLLDMHMPRLTGLETLRRFKQMNTRLPCILLSAELSDALAEQARQANAFSVLAKPFRSSEITSLVNRAMRQTYDWPPKSHGEGAGTIQDAPR